MIIIYAADIGSIKKENFAWARLDLNLHHIHTDTSINNLVELICDDLNNKNKVCLGFECPLFINLPTNPLLLTSSRVGEGSRAWSAAAGSGALTTGLSEILWIFTETKKIMKNNIIVTFKIEDLINNSFNLLIWEAFVSSKAKGKNHIEDSIKAVEKFAEKFQNGTIKSDVYVTEKPYSIVGASLLHSEITNDIEIIKKQCIVVKV